MKMPSVERFSGYLKPEVSSRKRKSYAKQTNRRYRRVDLLVTSSFELLPGSSPLQPFGPKSGNAPHAWGREALRDFCPSGCKGA